MFGLALIDWGIALVPVLCLVGLFVWLDIFKLMSLTEIVLLLVLGGLAALVAYPIAGRLIDTLPLGFSFYSRIVAPWIEETLKACALVFLFVRNRIGYKLDAVISGFAIGAGFSVVENIFYLLRFPDYPPNVWMVRGLGTALMHGATCAILAAVAHELSERSMRRAAASWRFNPLWFVPGLAIAAGLHTLFNQFPDQPMTAMMGALVGAPIVVMGLFAFGSNEAKTWLLDESADHKAALAKFGDGGFPDDASGQRIATLAARSGPVQGGRIHDYVATHMALVVMAEEKLLGQAVPARPEIEALFAKLDALPAAIGRTGFAALKPLLPFSRNDLWEMNELREDLHKDD